MTLPSQYLCYQVRHYVIIIDPAFAAQLNCFTQLRALLVLHDRGHLVCPNNTQSKGLWC